jgi:hypothetical protein
LRSVTYRVSVAVDNILGKRCGRLGIYLLENYKSVKMRRIGKRISVLEWLILTRFYIHFKPYIYTVIISGKRCGRLGIYILENYAVKMRGIGKRILVLESLIFTRFHTRL